MFRFWKRSVGEEDISDRTLKHSSKGDYTKTNRLKGGGHGQEALDYMDKNGIEYNITETYSNGVRVGNVPNHVNRYKRSDIGQSWFPKDWDRKKIKKAGQSVAKGKKYPNGETKCGRYKDIEIGIKRTNGKIATIFPLNRQGDKRRKK